MNAISGQIKRYRREKGLTQEQLGASVGVSMQAVSKWERGGTPDIELLPAIADVLGVSIDELFGRQKKSLEETIADVVYAVDSKNSYEYAFELCWAAFLGLAHIDGNLEGNRKYNYRLEDTDVDKGYFSKLILDGGIACARLDPDFHTFFLMPEPKGNLRDKLADIHKLQKLFEAFADIDTLTVLLLLYTRLNTPVAASFVSKETGISKERAEEIMERLCQSNLLFRTLATTSDGDINIYLFKQESAVIPLLCFADEILSENIRDIIMDISRTKPLFHDQ